MGAAQGSEAGEPEGAGYRVLGVQNGSPAASAGLVSFFDFITEANGVPLTEPSPTLVRLIAEHEDRPLPLTIFNAKSGSSRAVTITPTQQWPGAGMLGVTIRFDSYANATHNLLHVLSVQTGGPAELAGLTPQTDYLLGTAERVFKNPSHLTSECMAHLDHTLEMYVYNVVTDAVRTVVVMPTVTWAGEGCLGADVGHGYVHQLPSTVRGSNGLSATVARAPANARVVTGAQARRKVATPYGLGSVLRAREDGVTEVELEWGAVGYFRLG